MAGFQVFSVVESAITAELIRFAVFPISILSAGIMMVAIPVLLSYLIYKTYLVMAGLVSEPVPTLLKEFAVRGCIIGLAGSLGLLYSHLVYPLMDTQTALAQDFSASGSKSIFVNIEKHITEVGNLIEAAMGIDENGMSSYVEQATQANNGEPLGFFGWAWESLKDTGAQVSAAAENLGGFFKLFMLVSKFAIVIIGLLIMGVAAFIPIMLNKVFFMLGLGFAPLFIMFLAFDSTRGWFSSWLSSTLGYCLSYPLAMMVISVLLNIYSGLYNQKDLTFTTALICLATSIVFSVIIARIGDVASNWFSAQNIADGTAGFVAAAFSKTISSTATVTRMAGKGAGATVGVAGGVVKGAAIGAWQGTRGGYRLYQGFRNPKVEKGD